MEFKGIKIKQHENKVNKNYDSFHIMTNFEAFHRNISSIIKIWFLKSVSYQIFFSSWMTSISLKTMSATCSNQNGHVLDLKSLSIVLVMSGVKKINKLIFSYGFALIDFYFHTLLLFIFPSDLGVYLFLFVKIW